MVLVRKTPISRNSEIVEIKKKLSSATDKIISGGQAESPRENSDRPFLEVLFQADS